MADLDRIKLLATEARTDPAKREPLFREVCQYVVGSIRSTRASVWSFNPAGTSITCECLFDELEGKFTSGTTLNEEDFPPYFKAIKDDLKVVAPDALRHPATSCFNDVYFNPLDIKSLLDFVILSGAEPVGVLCCEHCGEMKQWTPDHVDTLHRLATVLGLAWKRRPALPT